MAKKVCNRKKHKLCGTLNSAIPEDIGEVLCVVSYICTFFYIYIYVNESDSWTLRQTGKNKIEAIEIWIWSRMKRTKGWKGR